MSFIRNHFLVISLILLFILFGVICFFPYLFTLKGHFDFRETGQIGDTIGGTMSPFVAILAALVTYAAFWVQYQANLDQRKDISKERIENRFFNMLEVYRQNASMLEAGKYHGKDAAEELLGEYFYTYSLTKEFFNLHFRKCKKAQRNGFSNNVKEALKFLSVETREQHFLTRISYGFFYYGKRYEFEPRIDEEKKLCELVEIIKQDMFAVKHDPQGFDYKSFYEKEHTDIDLSDCPYNYPPLIGHNNTLGCYFRHLYQLTQYVSSINESIENEVEKYERMKILRSQMSDFEQALLFYNSISDFGLSWNQNNASVDKADSRYMGYIGRFLLIKHIPTNIIWYGITPMDIYPEEIAFWDKRQKQFIERESLSVVK